MKEPHENCECHYCKYGEAHVTELEKKSIIKYGWYAHLITDSSDTPFNFEAHTHGIAESFNHPDLQIVLPMKANIIMNILHDVVNQIIKPGNAIAEGRLYDNILGNGYKIKFITATESGRKVFRAIIPGPDGNYKGIYGRQYEGLPNVA